MASGVESPPSLADRVRAVLDQIRPAVKADGGDVELVNVDQGVANVRFHGACIGCPSAGLTLHMGIERAIKSQIPEITKVVAID